MFRHFHITQKADAAVGSMLVFLLSCLWLMHRSLHFLPAACLSALLCGLLAYALFLYKKQASISNTQKKAVQKSVYALTMLETEQALEYAGAALAKQYDLLLLKRPSVGCHLLACDKCGRKISVAIHNTPIKPDKNCIHALHKARGKLPAVLIYTEHPSEAAVQYAQQLTPALKLLSADSLPLNTELSKLYPFPDRRKKKRTAASLLHAGAGHAVRCMLFSAGMTVLYLITGSRNILYPALALAFVALVNKTQNQKSSLF